MSATKVMVFAILAGVVGRWANNKKALPSIQGTLQVAGAVVLISVLDQGKSAPVARGFAWLFTAAVFLSPDSPLTGLAKAESLSTPSPATAAQNNADLPLPTVGPKGSNPQTGKNTTQRSQ